MSWFDASGIANLAKSALKEAQKTIDKALDIQEEEQRKIEVEPVKDDFFATWGINEPERGDQGEKKSMPNSIWGSFTGSFFENQQQQEVGIRSSRSLHDDLGDASGSGRSARSSSRDFARRGADDAVVNEEDASVSGLDRFELDALSLGESSDTLHEEAFSRSQLVVELETEVPKQQRDEESERRVVERGDTNRISIVSNVSTSSDKRSSESVEILGSRSDCTTSPESEVNSISESSPAEVRVNSDSVEVLPDSGVTSPSSVEILAEWNSEPVSPATPVPREDAFAPSTEVRTSPASDISPYRSPVDEEPETLCLDPLRDDQGHLSDTKRVDNPEIVEVVPEVDESEELSLAEDSYTSASESMLLTVVESVQLPSTEKPSPKSKSSESYHKIEAENRLSSTNQDPPREKKSPEAGHGAAPITTQPVRKLEHLENVKMTDLVDQPLECATIEPPDPPDIFEESPDRTRKNETEQLLGLEDSSGEGTLVESSSEENATLLCDTEPKIVPATLTSSSYVRNMLADAMTEKNEIMDLARRENSPVSSESRSDLVKIGSDQTSGHTSGDELETTTSSDIEIISSPNGDSSSTQSRQSPTKMQSNKNTDLLAKTLSKVRGHSRELSEISVGSDDANVEAEKLLKRIQELTEILEARESKLVDVSRTNVELHEENSSLKGQLDKIRRHAEENQDLSQITEEYTQRLSALERKFQQAIRERDTLRKQMDQLKRDAASRVSPQELTSLNAEKDEIIKELREEGEKLSRQQLQHSNIIKKLRSKERESDLLVQQQKEQIEEQNLELERLKRSLNAKEEVERSQIEAVHSLTAKTKKQEKELSSLQEKLDDASQKLDTYKKSFDAAKTELTETKQNLEFVREELKEAIDNAGESSQLSAQVRDLKSRLRRSEEDRVKREETSRQETNELLKRLECSEARNEELSESLSTATKPLLRQLEQLQSNLSHKTESFAKQEKSMAERIIELQTKLDALIRMDRTLKEENCSAKSRVSSLEAKINAKQTDVERLTELIEEMKIENEKVADEKTKYQQMFEGLEKKRSNEVRELKREISSLEHKLSVEKAAIEAERRKNSTVNEQQQSVEDEMRLSPTLSIGRDSVSSSSSVWPAFNDSMFDSGSGRFANVYESVRVGANSTSMIENLQAQLKQRDGEIQQLQWEMSRRNTERDALNTELSHLTGKVETLRGKIVEIESLNENLSDVRTKYDALLQMYGEKVEENQELRLDLEDVKEMYKSQIDQLLKRDA